MEKLWHVEGMTGQKHGTLTDVGHWIWKVMSSSALRELYLAVCMKGKASLFGQQ